MSDGAAPRQAASGSNLARFAGRGGARGACFASAFLPFFAGTPPASMSRAMAATTSRTASASLELHRRRSVRVRSAFDISSRSSAPAISKLERRRFSKSRSTPRGVSVSTQSLSSRRLDRDAWRVHRRTSRWCLPSAAAAQAAAMSARSARTKVVVFRKRMRTTLFGSMVSAGPRRVRRMVTVLFAVFARRGAPKRVGVV